MRLTRLFPATPGWVMTETITMAAVGTAAYFLVPLPGRMRTGSWVVLFCVGAAVLGALIVVSIRKLLTEGGEIRLRGLILLLCLTVLFFSYADVILAAQPGEFAGMKTRIDALYFTVSTLSTVGFGDVHATGQTARAAVTLQVVFNLVFLGAAVGTITRMWQARASRRIHHHDGGATGGGSTPAS
jgi:voltage-gated potassium channel